MDLPVVPKECRHNSHMFYIKAKDLVHRQQIITYMKSRELGVVFHYVPLHSSEGGRKYSRFSGKDEYTTKESNRLIRLPMWYRMKEEDVEEVIKQLKAFTEMNSV